MLSMMKSELDGDPMSVDISMDDKTIMSVGRYKMGVIKDKEEMTKFTFEYVVGDIVHIVAETVEEANALLEQGNYEVIEAYSECVAVRNA